VREIREEIGVEIAVGAVLGESPISDGLVLRLLEAELLTGEEEARFDHDEVRWFAARDLPGVTWLPADRALLPAVVRRLTGP
jgi:8-oxo-dGTP diphosphatase